MWYNGGMTEKGIEVYKVIDGEVVFDVDKDEDTIWATQAQIAEVFGVDRTVVGRHLRNIFKSGELEEEVVCAKNAHTTRHGAMGGKTQTREVKIYNLDAIISVGYRVNSVRATKFRIWATKVLKKYTVSGLAVNERRVAELPEGKLEGIEGALGVVRRLIGERRLSADEATGLLEVISSYEAAFRVIEEYDSGHISFRDKRKARRELTVEKAQAVIDKLRVQIGGSELFGKVREGKFQGSLATIYTTFNGEELYPTVGEKAANLLYFIIKDHPFYDGNKRIGALLFIVFLTINDYSLNGDGEVKISDKALAAIALLIAESEPKEKELICSLVCKLLE